MKTFKSFVTEAKPNAKPKAKGEADFVDAHTVDLVDPENQEGESAKVVTKAGSGKRKADRLDNKQAMGEDTGQADARKTTPSSKEAQQKVFDKHKERMKQLAKEEVEELDELEKSTLASYVKKRVKQIPKIEVGYQMAPSDRDARRIKKYQSKVNKGIGRAVDRLAKEEVELDEEELLEMDKSGVPFTPNKSKKNPPAKAGKYGQGPSTAKHLAKMGMKQAQKETQKEEVEEIDENPIVGAVARAAVGSAMRKAVSSSSNKEEAYTNPGLEALAKKKKSLRQMKQEMAEADFSKKETKMAHTIGKEFEKKGVGDKAQGGPYAVASAMVRDKPEAAKKAYKTIQSKMKEEIDADILFKLYDDLNEENQAVFMEQLETDAEGLLEFAKSLMEE